VVVIFYVFICVICAAAEVPLSHPGMLYILWRIGRLLANGPDNVADVAVCHVKTVYHLIQACNEVPKDNVLINDWQ